MAKTIWRKQLVMLVGPVRQISLARYLDDPGVNRNVAGERWTKIDMAQLEQAYHLNDGETS
jgi:hypothetical protein